MNARMFPGPTPPSHTTTVNGRTYNCQPSSFVDVPDFDGKALEAAGWVFVCLVGPSSARTSGTLPPTNWVRGQHFYDTTLSKMIVCDAGGIWRDPATGSAV